MRNCRRFAPHAPRRFGRRWSTRERIYPRIAAALVALSVFAADRWSKWMIETHLSPDSVRSVIPGFFNLVRSENPGVAFSMLSEGGGRFHTPALVLLSVVAIAILAGMLWKIDRLDRLSAIGVCR